MYQVTDGVSHLWSKGHIAILDIKKSFLKDHSQKDLDHQAIDDDYPLSYKA